jgi:hypothetical protein
MSKARVRKTRCRSSSPAEVERQLRADMIKNGIRFGGPGSTMENLKTGEIVPCDKEFHVPITAALYDKARMLGWSSNQLFAEAIRLAYPDMDIVVDANPAKPPASPLTHH